MTRKRHTLVHERYHRPLMNEVLPFEIPPTFSNAGFFLFCSRINLKLQRDRKDFILSFQGVSLNDLLVLDFLFPCKDSKISVTATSKKKIISQWNKKEIGFYSLKIDHKNLPINTKPLNFNISHKGGKIRELSIPHPRNQLDICNIYDKFHAEIIDICARSSFSIRRPYKRAKTSIFNDTIQKSNHSHAMHYREEFDKAYENIGSYFSYYRYSNVYRFYESYTYHNAERKFNLLLRQDIQRCFDSIYTHTIAWASHTKEAIKDNLPQSYYIFTSLFDTVQRSLNYNETNGIVIGPEFSRIFSEIILQDVDVKVENILWKDYNIIRGVDYECFRYVDDYFIFCNDIECCDKISFVLQGALKEKKLSLSDTKKEIIEKPLITSITKAKDRILFTFKTMISDNYIDKDENLDELGPYYPSANANQIIKSIKTIISDTGTSYNDTLNYFLTVLNEELSRKFDKFNKSYLALIKKNEYNNIKYNEVKKFILAIMEPLFFVGLSEPKVNFTLKICRIICQTIDFMSQVNFPKTHREDVIKFIDDNIKISLSKISKKKNYEIELLYFLLAHGKLGRDVSLSEENISSIFCNEEYNCDYFTASVLLIYIRNRNKYKKIKSFCFNSILKNIKNRLPYKEVDTTFTIMVMDALACPYFTKEQKNTIIELCNLPINFDENILCASRYWFTEWYDFDLSRALDKKRVREVY